MSTDTSTHSRTLRLTSRDGTSIAYERWGSGPPLILVDGAFCSRRFGPTDKLAPLLAQYFTVYAYDRRGRAESTDSKTHSVHREVEDLAALIAAAGNSVRVFGMSSGGALALQGASAGLPIEKLAVYEVPYFDDAEVQRPPIDLSARLTTYLEAGDRGRAIKFYMTDVMQMPRLLVGIIPLTSNWTSLKASAPSLLHEAALMGDFRPPVPVLAAISTTTLAIVGGKSKELMRGAAKAVGSYVPGARTETLQGQSHDVSMEVLAPVLQKFFT